MCVYMCMYMYMYVYMCMCMYNVCVCVYVSCYDICGIKVVETQHLIRRYN